MFATAQELVDASKEGRSIHELRPRQYDANGMFSYKDLGYTGTASRPILTYDGAVSLLQFAEQEIKKGVIFGKSNRPWYIVPMERKLDVSRAWIGFEFETGFENEAARRDVMSWVWDNTMHSVMDREGAGQYLVEITFAPDYEEAYLERRSDMHRLYEYIAKKGYNTVPARTAGTHANISIPEMRGNKWFAQYVRMYTNNVLQELNRQAAFGREPYGWGSVMDTTHGHIEFKLFMSATEVAQFDGYVEVSIAIKNFMTELAAYFNSIPAQGHVENAAFFALRNELKHKHFAKWI